ncbi:hypothetical protein [Bacillus gaemokensis]|uniref:Uncharacterized protein n=1 Tax=Bacillus gaemokensis TaxID=574375 RepID=A0A073KA58_9BACI|nr:hypothetical protein [Bacillus gaemokensis]KEK23406.1 hypothetical protein BAGA_08915 [Bacillus gaemokensis]KYG25849.1 hypothetical protein AZF08_17630 [Bacillus gaemokensis]
MPILFQTILPAVCAILLFFLYWNTNKEKPLLILACITGISAIESMFQLTALKENAFYPYWAGLKVIILISTVAFLFKGTTKPKDI